MPPGRCSRGPQAEELAEQGAPRPSWHRWPRCTACSSPRRERWSLPSPGPLALCPPWLGQGVQPRSSRLRSGDAILIDAAGCSRRDGTNGVPCSGRSSVPHSQRALWSPEGPLPRPHASHPSEPQPVLGADKTYLAEALLPGRPCPWSEQFRATARVTGKLGSWPRGTWPVPVRLGRRGPVCRFPAEGCTSLSQGPSVRQQDAPNAWDTERFHTGTVPARVVCDRPP